MEILSPAGKIESLKSAVYAGADAVYFGLGELNARAKSVDFGKDNLKEWVDFCHFYGVKVYVTLNVNIYDTELEKALGLAKVAYESKVDALIVSDTGLIHELRRTFPDFPIHVSTQAGVKNALGAEFFKKFGVTRVVLSRESNFSDIESIKGIEKEIFVHGALCVAFSGNCLLSCSIGGFSGNRGECRQPCRQLYSAFDIKGNKLKEGFLLSAKDTSLDSYVDELKKLQVDSLKIEGRLKSPEYAYSATKYFKDLTLGEKADKKDILVSFNRGGFTNAYFETKNVIYTKTASHIGLPVGKILKKDLRKGYSFATVDCQLQKGDGVKILRKGIEVGGSDVTSCIPNGLNWVIPISSGISVGDTVCLTRSAELSKKVESQKKLVPINFHLILKGKESKLIAKSGKSSIEFEIEEPMTERELTLNEVKNQFSKTGGTKFFANDITLKGQGYFPKSYLNSIRKEAIERLERKICDDYTPLRISLYKKDGYSVSKYCDKVSGSVVEVDNLNFDTKKAKTFVYYPKFISINAYQKAVDFAKSNGLNLFIKFPTLIKEDELREYVEFAQKNNIGVYANNISVVQCARDLNVPYIAGLELNITNKVTEKVFSDSALTLASVEMGDMRLSQTSYVYAYGRVPLMTFEHCPNFVCSGFDCDRCIKKAQNLIYKHDKDSYLLRGVRAKHRCYYTLYSGKKLDMKINNNNKYMNLIEDGNISVFESFKVN